MAEPGDGDWMDRLRSEREAMEQLGGDSVSRVAVVSSQLMSWLERDLPDGARIGEVVVIVEVHAKVDPESREYVELREGEAPNVTEVRYRCSDPRAWVHRGLMAEALRIA